MNKLRISARAGFTLVELMVSTSILALIMAILLQMTSQTASTWRMSAAKVEQFQEARKAFETMTRRLGDATLNTYWDYYYPETAYAANANVPEGVPTDYVRQSELRFRVVKMNPDYQGGTGYRPTHGVFFQAPFGNVEDQQDLGKMDNLLNSWGYFVEVADTGGEVPDFLEPTNKRVRSRLMEFRQTAESMSVYNLNNQYKGNNGKGLGRPDPVVKNGIVEKGDDQWFLAPLNLTTKRPVRVLAENIVALVLLPKLSPADEQSRRDAGKTEVMLSPEFTYHSKQVNNYGQIKLQDTKTAGQLNPKNQLPPTVQVFMVALDEASADRMASGTQAEDAGLEEMLQGEGQPLFEKAEKLESNGQQRGGDLEAFENALIKKRLTYRLFSSNVAIRGAKWSSASAK